MLRLDHETKQDISSATEKRLLAVLEERIDDLDANHSGKIIIRALSLAA